MSSNLDLAGRFRRVGQTMGAGDRVKSRCWYRTGEVGIVLVEPAAVRQAEAVAVVLIGFAAFVALCAAVEAVTGITL